LQAGVITRRRSEGDRRRAYLRLVPGTLNSLAAAPAAAVPRVLFVCTANSARRTDRSRRDRRRRHHRLPLPRLRPRPLSEVEDEGDLVVTVCDLAREELGGQASVHWSVPDPVPAGDPASFDTAVADLRDRVGRLAPHLVATS
jgi:protein-tyrosine-phosphatase